MLVALLALHAFGGFSALLGARLGRRALLLGVLGPVAVVLWAMRHAGRIVGGDVISAQAEWVPDLGLGVDLRVDAFALLMLVLVSGIGTLVFAYAWWYFADSPHVGRAAGLLALFAGSMFGVVIADNLLLLYVCWELTSVTSYLLIGIDDAQAEARDAASHALLVTGFGGLVMLGGFILLGQQAGTYRISELLADPPGGTAVAVALVLVLVGAFTKSAQYPFHGWLPAAMVAPTPISAYLHSAAMVKAGVYLIARLAPSFADIGVWRPLVVSVGLFTMIAGGLRALRPFDLKALLAFGTISQLGFLVVLFGLGRPSATAAGCVLLLAHGLFKAALFMVVGILDHQVHTRDPRRLPLLGPRWGPTKAVALLSAASMAAVPPLAGFVAKESAYDALAHGRAGDRVLLAGIVAGSVLTVAYSLRFAAALVRPDLLGAATRHRPASPPPPSARFLSPPAAMATATVLLGVAPGLWSRLVDAASVALDPASGTRLRLWHGFTVALLLSMFTLAAGAGLFAGRRGVAALQARSSPGWSATTVYVLLVRAVTRVAGQVTSVVQSGSLPIYAAVVLLTAAVAPGTALLAGSWWRTWPDVVGNAAHVPIAGLLMGGGIAATIARRRFAAALLLGAVGYGMAVLFVAQGAPDLALTQFAVETLSIVVFLLVLRRLPDRFEGGGAPAMGSVLRVGVSCAVAVFVALMAIATSGARTEAPVSREMSERALPEGDGRNIVNVILVDIRGLDTLGEITVLAVAGVGITALARAGRPPPGRSRVEGTAGRRRRSRGGGLDRGVKR